MTPRELDDWNVSAFAAGPSQSGKSRALWELFASRHPRRLSFDFVGEVRRKVNPDAIEVFSFAELEDALRVCARYRQWHIAVCIDYAKIPELAPKIVRLLVPPRTSASSTSYARAVGGLAVDCGEADYLVPNTQARWVEATRGLFQRGRHHWISLFMATQYPALVSRVVTDASQYLLAFQTQEGTAWKYWASITSGAVADAIAELPLYWCVYIVKAQQRVYVLDEQRRVQRVTDYKGRPLTAGGMATLPAGD